MKREAADWGADFTVGFDEGGFMAEGAAESFGIVTRSGELLFPRKGKILEGTTMMRVVQLAEGLVRSGELSSIGFRDISEDAVARGGRDADCRHGDSCGVPCARLKAPPSGAVRPARSAVRWEFWLSGIWLKTLRFARFIEFGELWVISTKSFQRV
jgi:hypothetical protein